MKMMLIGLGSAPVPGLPPGDPGLQFRPDHPERGREVLSRCHILAGLAIVENAYDETARIEVVAPDDFELRERELLRQAGQWMPSLPFDRAECC